MNNFIKKSIKLKTYSVIMLSDVSVIFNVNGAVIVAATCEIVRVMSHF